MSNRSSNKRPRSPPHVAVSTRFKGVVPQISGHWGAQIYANHQRIWLGTFKSEKEAAMAYDTAAIKLRCGDSHRNFPWSPVTMQEPLFQKYYSTESVLNMIKDGSYATKFSEFLKQNRGKSDEDDVENFENVAVGSSFFMENNNVMMVNGMEKFKCRKLFRKELTPSDVGKLNRLVIPKKMAVKFFPEIISAEAIEESQGDVQLSFYDPFARLWKFRYCYWKSSQSFVFTRGWNRFVKEKELKAKDVITFFVCEGHPKSMKTSSTSRTEVSSFYLIDVSYRHAKNNNDNGEDVTDYERKEMSEVAEEKEGEDSATEVREQNGGSKKTTSLIRLFGVDIQK